MSIIRIFPVLFLPVHSEEARWGKTSDARSGKLEIGKNEEENYHHYPSSFYPPVSRFQFSITPNLAPLSGGEEERYMYKSL